MTTEDKTDIEKALHEIKNNQQVLMTISKKHLELYAQQISKTDELTNIFIDLQKQSQQHQRFAIIFALITIFAVAAYVLIMTS